MYEMAFILLWIYTLTVPTRLLHASLDSFTDIYREVFWHPHYSLKQYHSFQDAKVYVLNVPPYISDMRLIYRYQGKYLDSHKPCNNSITVLLQYGSPAIPYRDKIQTDSWLYNNTDHYDSTVSLSRLEVINIPSPFPGKWYVTTFLPHVEKDKKIKEKGLSKADDKCLSALSILQQMISPPKPLVVLAKGQHWKTIGNPKNSTRTYFKYFVPTNSRRLRVKLNISCPSQVNCSLKLSLSAATLPTTLAPSCMAPCGLTINWPQAHSDYYIEVSGTSQSYEITANHTECRADTPGCVRVEPILRLSRSLLVNNWHHGNFNTSRILNTTRVYYSLEIDPDYVGTTVEFLVRPPHPKTNATYTMCISKDLLPSHSLESSDFSKKYCSERRDGDLRMEIVYPQSGTWYIAVTVKHPPPFQISNFAFYAKTKTCLSNCNNHGSCIIKSDIGVSYGLCVCDYGYTGFTCSDFSSLDLLAVCLLTISNIAFIPGVIVACRRRFYPEAVVYLFNMYCSTVYHACDSHGYCIYDYNTLQLSDFFASVLSVWFTLITMTKLRSLWHRTLNIAAVLSLVIGVQLARFGILIIAIPAGIGLIFVLLSFVCRCRKRKKCFPSWRRWLFFLLPACVLASTAVGIYMGLETTANYKYLHSVWHIAIALCIPLFLPTVRTPKLYIDRQVNREEYFGDSDESFLLNERNNDDDNEEEDPESNVVTFPRLIT